MGVLTLLVMGLNYYIPIYGAKKYGGSRYGSVGALVGFFLGMFFIPTPFGFLIGTIAGAFLGELIRNINNVDGALRSAWGSFVGFLLSTGLSLIVSSGMLALILFHNACWF